MKITVCYDVCFDVDVPEDAIKAIKEQGLDNLNEGDALNTYFIENCASIRKALNLCDGADIQGVYNGEYEFVDDDVIFTNNWNEIIWEG